MNTPASDAVQADEFHAEMNEAWARQAEAERVRELQSDTSGADDLITIHFRLSDSDCADAICTALESGNSGILYWCQPTDTKTRRNEDVRDPLDWMYESSTLIELDDEENVTDECARHTLDYAAIRRGVQRILSGEVGIRGDLRDQIFAEVVEAARNNGFAIDADAADCVVQAGVLGELRYG